VLSVISFFDWTREKGLISIVLCLMMRDLNKKVSATTSVSASASDSAAIISVVILSTVATVQGLQ
jgi:hypothetical protein